MTTPPASPRLTIAIPTLNRASLVGRAIDSAIAQTYPDVEILVSNNGSTDDTSVVLQRYVGVPRVRILQRETTLPVDQHGNFLIREARGRFFLGLSDDDWLEPDMAARVVERFDRRPDLAFVWTGCWMHYQDFAFPALTGPDVETGAEFLAAFLAGRRNVCWCACVTRTADLQRLGPLPPGILCGDMFFWTQLAGEGPVGCVPQPLSHYVHYRDGGDGIAGGARLKEWTDEQQVWVRDMLAVCAAAQEGRTAPEAVVRDAGAFLARTIANQFVWNALRGADRMSLLTYVPRSVPILAKGTLRNWVSVIASLVAPRALLRHQLLSIAAARSRAAKARGS